jgi:hypothetical protein
VPEAVVYDDGDLRPLEFNIHHTERPVVDRIVDAVTGNISEVFATQSDFGFSLIMSSARLAQTLP